MFEIRLTPLPLPPPRSTLVQLTQSDIAYSYNHDCVVEETEPDEW